MKRKSLLCLLIICLLLASFPERVEAATFTTDLTFTGSTASCLVSIKQFGKKITATMELWQQSGRLLNTQSQEPQTYIEAVQPLQ